MVVEAGNSANVITKINRPFLVMTNFHNGDFQETKLSDIRGNGAKRYQIACAYIDKHLEDFYMDHAFGGAPADSADLGRFQNPLLSRS